MSKDKKAKKRKARAEPASGKSPAAWLCSPDAYDVLVCQGYTSLAHNPEISSAVGKIATLIGSMTIHLLQNTGDGDIRVVNELSRKIDIDPNNNMTRSTFVQWIIRTLYLEGNGNCIVYPQTRRGYLSNLQPVPATMVTFLPEGIGDYRVSVNGSIYDPEDVLHFILNPDDQYPWKGSGLKVVLKDVANNLRQAAATLWAPS